MSKSTRKHIPGVFLALFLLLSSVFSVSGASGGDLKETTPQVRVASVHAGFLYPNGVDVAGYTVEKGINNDFYWFYTFGFPSLAAVGVSCYGDYGGSGLAASAGAGIGSVLYGSLFYQLRLADRHFLKLGGGYATGIAYTGLYPAVSYEFRLK